MKQVFAVLTAFLILLIAGTLAGTTVAVIYSQCTGYVAGTTMPIISAPMVLSAFFSTLPVLLLISPLFLTLYIIRHPVKISEVIVYYVLEIITCFIFLPLSLKSLRNSEIEKQNYYETQRYAISERHLLSSGYFRDYGDYINYYTSVRIFQNQDDQIVSGVRFKVTDLTHEESLNPEILTERTENSLRTENPPITDKFSREIGQTEVRDAYADSLAANVLEPPLLLKWLLHILSMVSIIAMNINEPGAYMALVSMGLALILIYPLKNISTWKLLRTLFVIMVTVLVLSINAANYYQIRIWTWFESIIPFALPFDWPLIFYVNVILCIAFANFGLILGLKQKGGSK